LRHGQPVVQLLDRTHHAPQTAANEASTSEVTASTVKWLYGVIAIAVGIMVASLLWTLWR
jgi:hypothetical protein